MNSSEPETQTIDQYISRFPRDVQEILTSVRATIRKAAPKASEKISYRMPTFYFNGNLVHFAAFKNHIGFFPTGRGVSEFEKDLSGYKHSKGSIQFPLDRPMPLSLIRRIVQRRVKQNTAAVPSKKAGKTAREK